MMAGWQKIETAPKDGTTIIGWADDEESGWQPMVVHWVEEQVDPNSPYVEHDAGWAGRILYPGGPYGEPTFTITHWMHLPDPPEAE